MEREERDKLSQDVQDLKDETYGNRQVKPPVAGILARIEVIEQYIKEDALLKAALNDELEILEDERKARTARTVFAKELVRWLGPAGLLGLFTWLYRTFGGGQGGTP